MRTGDGSRPGAGVRPGDAGLGPSVGSGPQTWLLGQEEAAGGSHLGGHGMASTCSARP